MAKGVKITVNKWDYFWMGVISLAGSVAFCFLAYGVYNHIADDIASRVKRPGGISCSSGNNYMHLIGNKDGVVSIVCNNVAPYTSRDYGQVQ